MLNQHQSSCQDDPPAVGLGKPLCLNPGIRPERCRPAGGVVDEKAADFAIRADIRAGDDHQVPAAVRDRRDPTVTGRDGLETLRVALSFVQSGGDGAPKVFGAVRSPAAE